MLKNLSKKKYLICITILLTCTFVLRLSFLMIRPIPFWYDEILMLLISTKDFIELSKFDTYPFFPYLLVYVFSRVLDPVGIRFFITIITFVIELVILYINWFYNKKNIGLVLGLLIFFNSSAFYFSTLYIRPDFISVYILLIWFTIYYSLYVVSFTRGKIFALIIVTVLCLLSNYYLTIILVSNYFLLFIKFRKNFNILFFGLIVQLVCFLIFLYIFLFQHLQNLLNRGVWTTFLYKSFDRYLLQSFIWYWRPEFFTDLVRLFLYIIIFYYFIYVYRNFKLRKIIVPIDMVLISNLFLNIAMGYLFGLFVFPRYSIFLTLTISLIISRMMYLFKIYKRIWFIFIILLFFMIVSVNTYFNEYYINYTDQNYFRGYVLKNIHEKTFYVSNFPMQPYLWRSSLLRNYDNLYPIVYGYKSSNTELKNVISSDKKINTSVVLNSIKDTNGTSFLFQQMRFEDSLTYGQSYSEFVISYLKSRCVLKDYVESVSSSIYLFKDCSLK